MGGERVRCAITQNVPAAPLPASPRRPCISTSVLCAAGSTFRAPFLASRGQWAHRARLLGPWRVHIACTDWVGGQGTSCRAAACTARWRVVQRTGRGSSAGSSGSSCVPEAAGSVAGTQMEQTALQELCRAAGGAAPATGARGCVWTLCSSSRLRSVAEELCAAQELLPSRASEQRTALRTAGDGSYESQGGQLCAAVRHCAECSPAPLAGQRCSTEQDKYGATWTRPRSSSSSRNSGGGTSRSCGCYWGGGWQRGRPGAAARAAAARLHRVPSAPPPPPPAHRGG